MWLDALLSYLHFTSIFLFFAFLSVELMLMRSRLDADLVRLLVRVDHWYWASVVATFVTGIARFGFGAKGPAFYLGAWPIYAKVILFLVVAIVSVRPTLRFVRWRRAFEDDASWSVPDDERKPMRAAIMLNVHLAAVIPFFAVMMARGLGH